MNQFTMTDNVDDATAPLDDNTALDDGNVLGEEANDDPEKFADDAASDLDDADLEAEEIGGGLRGGGDAAAASEEHAVVECSTTAGPIVLHLHRAWSPNGYDRASELFERGYYDHSHFFRVVPHFLVQFGISYSSDNELKHFADKPIGDDPRRENLMPFREGYVSFAGSGPNSRTSQLFIAYDRAGGLGQSPWETPFGEVASGMDNVRNLYSEYGDMPPWGKGPQQGPIRNRGSSYIEQDFPMLDKFETCTVTRTNTDPKEEIAVKKVVKQVKKAASEVGRGKTVTSEKVAPKAAPRELKDDKVAGTPMPLWGKIAIVGVLLAIFGHLVARRKRSKRDGKSV